MNGISHGEAAGVRVRLSGATLSPGLGPDIFVQAGALLGVGDLLKAFLSPTIETSTPTGPWFHAWTSTSAFQGIIGSLSSYGLF